MATLDAALVREQGVEFAVVVVRSSVLGSSSACSKAAASFAGVFPGLPIILMAQDGRGRPTYWGRRDIVQFLSRIAFQRLPWRKYSVS